MAKILEDDRPFHEKIVDVISTATDDEVPVLARLIRETIIPQNHLAISKIWNRRLKELGWDNDCGVDFALVRKIQELQKVKKDK